MAIPENNIMIGNDKVTEYDAQRVLLVVIMALTPCFMMGVYVFGLDMLDNMLGGCGLAVVLAWLMRKAGEVRASKPESAGAAGSAESVRAKRPDREPDLLAAVITGAIMVFGLPSTMPIHAVLIGAAVAMIPGRFVMDWILQSLERLRGKAGTGGSGAAYLLQRAIVTAVMAQVVLWLLFREEMNIWPLNDFVETRVQPGDVATGMTPLQILADGGDLPGLSRMFVGFISGPCGEVSVAAAAIGGVYLIWKKIISPWIPVCVLGSIFAASYVYYVTTGAGIAAEAAYNGAAIAALGPGNVSSTAVYLAFYQILSGGAVFGAFFLAPAICLCGTELIPAFKTSTAQAEAYQKPAGHDADGQSTKAVQEKARTMNVSNMLLQIAYSAGIGLIAVYFRIRGTFGEGIAAPVLTMCIAAYASAAVILTIRQKHEK